MTASIWAPGSSLDANSSVKAQAFTATAGQTVFDLTGFSYTPGTGSLLVFVSGLAQRVITDFVETDVDTFTLSEGVEEGTIVLAIGFVEITGTVVAGTFTDLTASGPVDLTDVIVRSWNAATAVLPVANGGTGSATASAARAALDAQEDVLTTVGDTVVATTGGVAARFPAYATISAHATTMNPWVATQCDISGGAVTITDIADAPYVGAVVWMRMYAAHTWTYGGTFAVQGNANYTCTAGDWIRLVALTVSTFAVTVFKADGTATAELPSKPIIRQAVRLGATDSSGYSALISAGAALNFNVDATPTNAVLDFAAGSTDYTATLTADATNQGSLVASNINYITADYVSSSSVTWGNYLIPPQYGYAFDRTQAALLNFEGSDASTTMLDDFGNTWTASGNAQIDTAQFKFGSSSLLLDGTGDYVTNSNFPGVGEGSWELSMWFRINALPGVGLTNILFSAFGSAVYNGFALGIYNNAGTSKLVISLSSNGSSFDIANSAVGTNTTWTLNQWNKVRLVFDALAGTYRIYLSLNGAAETQDYTISSTSRIAASTACRIGDSFTTGNAFNGWIDGFRFIRAATVTGTETPSASAFTVTSQPIHFFSISKMTMYEVTAASSSAGVNPTLTARNRVFVGECDTNGTVVTAVRNYAYQGRYTSDDFTVAGATLYTKSHNIGTVPKVHRVFLVSLNSTNAGHQQGQIIDITSYYDATGVRHQNSYFEGRNVVKVITATNPVGTINGTTGATGLTFQYADIRYRIECQRGW
jgi:hypothetical protein